MFTVIIAQKEYLERIEEYRLFLKPLTDSKDLAVCEWNTAGERFAEMLPSLPDTVGRRKEWRAVIICDESGLALRNPFDTVDFKSEPFPETIVGEVDDGIAEQYEAHQRSEHEKLLHAYEQASRQPLTRLTTFFCEAPTVTTPENETTDDPAFERYLAQFYKKQQLRAAIRGGEPLYTAAPKEIICISKRTTTVSENDFEIAWSSHTENEYSRFYDRNMYFDKMRYLVFDILPKTHRDYLFDSIRFLYATLLLAINDIPLSTLSPDRVYSLQCENDEEALRKLLFAYESKLNATKDLIAQRIQVLKEKQPVKLTDTEAEKIFCAKINIPVAITNDFDRSDLFVSKARIGLATDCPAHDEDIWQTEYTKSKKTLHRFLKQSRRSLTRAAQDARDNQERDLDKVSLLNEFQIEDVKEHIATEELGLLALDLPDLYEEDEYYDRLKKEDASIRKKIEERMTRRTTVAIGIAALIAYVIGFFTLFYKNAASNFFNISASLIITLSALGLFGLIALVTLFFLRRALTKRFDSYNRTMHGIDGDVEGAMAKYSVYLGHVCNVRRGFSVINASADYKDPDIAKVILYKKHILDIDTAKARTREVFGQFMVDGCDCDFSSITEYDYNFERPVEYVYPIPYSANNVKTIDFLNSGLPITIPVDFVKTISVRREELYD